MSYVEVAGVNLTAAQARLNSHIVRDFIARRSLVRKPSTYTLYALHDLLASFADETKSCATQQYSPSSIDGEFVDTAEAAAILGCTPQYVGRIRDRLGVREIGSQRIFPRQTVAQYAQRRARK